MENIKVSVIIITYNHFEYVVQSIESVLMQKATFGMEIIITDDCSTDHTQDILLEYQSKYPDLIRLILQKNNVGTTRNLCDAFEKCEGEYISCIAGDDYWIDPDKLQIQFDWLSEHPDYIGISHIVESRNNNGDLLGTYPTSYKLIGKDATVRLFLKGISYSTGSCMFSNIFKSKRAQEYIQLITSNRLVEDVSLAIILLDAGKIFVMNRCMTVYRTGDREGDAHYNSSRTTIQKLTDHMELYNANEIFFHNKYDFSIWRAITLRNFFIGCMLSNSMPAFYSAYKTTSLKVRSLLLVTIPYHVIYILIRKISRKITKFFRVIFSS